MITPSVSVRGTYTDNVNLDANKKSDFITALTPGIRLNGQSARASANLNYQLGYYLYARDSDLNEQRRTLAANGKLELVDNWLFVEGSQNVAQTTTSVFGTQSLGNDLANSNRSETSGYSISPYIQGRLAGVADYLLRFTGTSTRSDEGTLSGSASTTRSWFGRLLGDTRLASVGWAITADQRVASQGNSFDARAERLLFSLIYQIDPQIRLLASAGPDSDNFTGGVVRKTTATNLGVSWAPTERTLIEAKKDHHSFGDTHILDFSHRTALSAWRFSDIRTVVVPTSQLAQAQVGTAYELTYLALASSIPDPVERAVAVSQILAQSGVPENSPVYSSIQTSRVYLENRQHASFALFGVNNTVFFAASRSDSEQIETGIDVVDDFSQSSNIHQSGFNGSWTHNLTPYARITLGGGVSYTSGSANPETSLKTLSLLYTTRLGAKASGSVGLRKTQYDAGATGTSYDEQALTGYLSLTF